MENIKTEEFLQKKNKMQFASRRKYSLPLGAGSYLDYTSNSIHLLLLSAKAKLRLVDGKRNVFQLNVNIHCLVR